MQKPVFCYSSTLCVSFCRPKHTSISWSDTVENIVVYFSQQYILERMNIVFDNTTTITFFFPSYENFFDYAFFSHYFPNHYSRVEEAVEAACY